LQRSESCLTAREKVLRDAGVTAEQIQAAVRIAAVIHGVAVTLEAERTLQNQALAQAASGLRTAAEKHDGRSGRSPVSH